MDVSSAEDPVESIPVSTEQHDNMIDKDIELSVVLPGDVLKSTTVHGRYAAVAKMPAGHSLLSPLKPLGFMPSFSFI